MAIKNAPRTFITVDGEQVLVTNALMMERAVAALKATGEPQEIIDKATTHLAQLTKKSTTPKGESPAAKENAALAAKVLAIMPEGEYLLTSDIMERVHGIMTSQKCVKVMQVLIDAGKVERVPKAKGRYIGYRLV
jgi:hypothetical protein